MKSLPVLITLTFAAAAILIACTLSGCRSISVEKEGFKATYTNFGFDTAIGTLKVDRLDDGSFSIEAGDINSQSAVAKAIAEGVAAGLKK